MKRIKQWWNFRKAIWHIRMLGSCSPYRSELWRLYKQGYKTPQAIWDYLIQQNEAYDVRWYLCAMMRKGLLTAADETRARQVLRYYHYGDYQKMFTELHRQKLHIIPLPKGIQP